MNSVANLSAVQRAELFRETAARRGIAPAIIEKDFWVCWVLGRLFSIPELRGRIVFKGGTSLSKVFHAIERFSEDIDLIIDYEMLGFTGERHPFKSISRNQRSGLLREMLLACSNYVEGPFLSELGASFQSVLRGTDWKLTTRRGADEGAVVEFAYPRSLTEELDYVRPIVLLEPGTHAEFVPQGTYRIKPFASEEFPDLFAAPVIELEAITAERTFWEKATILHAEFHRPAEKRPGLRHSRHYYDLAMLAGTDIRRQALADRDLLQRVVKHKQEFYYSKWARYELALPGSFRLVPPAERLAELARDYAAMAVMMFGEPPSFEQIMRSLRELEAEINQLKPRAK